MYKIYIFFLFSGVVVASDGKDYNDRLCLSPLSISFSRIPSVENLIFEDGLIDADISKAKQNTTRHDNNALGYAQCNEIPTLSTDSEHASSSVKLHDCSLIKIVGVKDKSNDRSDIGNEKTLQENLNKRFQVAIKEQNGCVSMLQKLLLCSWFKK